MASSLVDNLVATAIVKASQELAFTSHQPPQHQQHQQQQQQVQVQQQQQQQQQQKVIAQQQNSRRNSENMKANTKQKTALVTNIDLNGANNENPPEIQIDLVGPRTPSPVEESSFELPSAPQKKYKFKVAYDGESMCNADDYSGEESSCAEPDWESSVSYNPNDASTHHHQHVVNCHHNHNDSQVVDVATTPELEIDLAQAHELSKHIVSEVINQAVDILKKENPNNLHIITTPGGQQFNLKREPESYSKISCHSSRTAASAGNCSWINRARHALSRIMRNACLCAKTKDPTFHV